MADSFFRNDTQSANKSDDGASDSSRQLIDDFSGHDGDIRDDDRLAFVMCYIPFLCIIPLLNMRDNKDIRFHARQGVVLFIVELIAALFLVDWVSRFVFKGVLIMAVICSAVAIYSTLQGKRLRLPIIADIADKLKL